MDIKDLKKDCLQVLKDLAYRKGDFTLSSGRKTEHYINCKPVIMHGLYMHFVSELLLQEIEEGSVAVGGLTLGADPLVCSVAMKSWMNKDGKKLSALIVRKEAKGHGTDAYIEGPLPEKDKSSKKRRRVAKGKARNLLERFKNKAEEILLFI